MLALLLAASLWPAPVIEFGPPRPLAPNQRARTVNRCCGSMAPLLRGGERIHVEPYTGQPLVGRIISNGQSLHMVTVETRTHVRTTGIANRHSDGWTPKTKIEYVVVYAERK